MKKVRFKCRHKEYLFFFMMRVVRHCNRLPKGQVGWVFEQPSLVEDVPGHGRGIRQGDLQKVPKHQNYCMVIRFYIDPATQRAHKV